jgi:hypothetical protein
MPRQCEYPGDAPGFPVVGGPAQTVFATVTLLFDNGLRTGGGCTYNSKVSYRALWFAGNQDIFRQRLRVLADCAILPTKDRARR